MFLLIDALMRGLWDSQLIIFLNGGVRRQKTSLFQVLSPAQRDVSSSSSWLIVILCFSSLTSQMRVAEVKLRQMYCYHKWHYWLVNSLSISSQPPSIIQFSTSWNPHLYTWQLIQRWLSSKFRSKSQCFETHGFILDMIIRTLLIQL